MGFFDLFRQPDINQGVEEYRAVPQAVLLDVRTPEEYRGGQIRTRPCSSTASPVPEAARRSACCSAWGM